MSKREALSIRDLPDVDHRRGVSLADRWLRTEGHTHRAVVVDQGDAATTQRVCTDRTASTSLSLSTAQEKVNEAQGGLRAEGLKSGRQEDRLLQVPRQTLRRTAPTRGSWGERGEGAGASSCLHRGRAAASDE